MHWHQSTRRYGLVASIAKYPVYNLKGRKGNSVGVQYQRALRAKIRELGADNLHVYLTPDALSHEYEAHVRATLAQESVRIVDNPADANMHIIGYSPSIGRAGCIKVSIIEHQLVFSGSLS